MLGFVLERMHVCMFGKGYILLGKKGTDINSVTSIVNYPELVT